MIRTWIKCPIYSSTRKWCLCIVSSPHLGDKSIKTDTGDPLHSRALAHSRAPLFTQPCSHCSYSRAPGEQWARLCVFTLHGCVQAARLCRGSPMTEQTWKLTGDDFTPGYRQRLWCLMKRMPTSHQPVSRFGSSVKSRDTYKIGFYVYTGSIIKSFWLQAR